MWSVCSSLQLVLVPPWKHQIKLLNHPSNSFRFNNFPPFLHILSSFSHDNDSTSSTPDKNQLGFDPSEELFGLDVDMPPRDVKSDGLEPRSWFGSNGQYVKELPCPSCRGRGYTPCTECGIERSRQDCSLCNGKGIITCQHCLGECVIWEESIDENPWEKARSISPLKVKEDDEVDNLELNLNARKKSKRVYRSTPPEVGLKISRSLKSLNAKTGIFSKRMKIIHRDPALHAQRVAAIKKAKGTPAARKHTSDTLKKFFSDPENRRKRSMSMKGVKFFCKNCGLEGHRSNYCPKREQNIDRRFKCGLCGEKGHNRRTCGKPSTLTVKKRILGQYHCRACGKVGHNSRTCSLKSKLQSDSDAHDGIGSRENSKGEYRSSFKGSKEKFRGSLKESKDKFWNYLGHLKGHVHQRHHCSICKKVGHNRRTCSLKTELQSHNTVPENRVSLEDAEGRDGGSHVVLKGENEGFFEDSKGNHGSSVEDSKGKYRSSFKDSKGSSTASLPDLNVILASENRGFSENIKDEYRGSLERIKGKYRDFSKDLKGEYRVSLKISNGVHSGFFDNSELHNKGSLEDSKGLHKGSLEDSNLDSHKHHHHHCGLCGKAGHNRRTCHLKTEQLSGSEAQNKEGSLNDSKEIAETRYHNCRVCGRRGHNRRTCFESSPKEVDVNTSIIERARSYRCRICGVIGHNRRTCVNKKG